MHVVPRMDEERTWRSGSMIETLAVRMDGASENEKGSVNVSFKCWLLGDT